MTSARLFLHRFRRPIAAASAALAVLLLASALRPAPPAQVDVVVVTVDLPSGAQLTADELGVRRITADDAPPGAIARIDDVTGRTLVGAIAAGEAVTETRLMDSVTRTDGLRLVPVRLSDPDFAGLLAPGMVVDLVQASRDTRGRVIAEGVRIVTVPRRSRDSGLGASPLTAGTLIVVATDRQTAVSLASAGSQTGVGVVMR